VIFCTQCRARRFGDAPLPWMAVKRSRTSQTTLATRSGMIWWRCSSAPPNRRTACSQVRVAASLDYLSGGCNETGTPAQPRHDPPVVVGGGRVRRVGIVAGVSAKTPDEVAGEGLLQHEAPLAANPPPVREAGIDREPGSEVVVVVVVPEQGVVQAGICFQICGDRVVPRGPLPVHIQSAENLDPVAVGPLEESPPPPPSRTCASNPNS